MVNDQENLTAPLKKLREQLPKKGYIKLIQKITGKKVGSNKPKYSRSYISCVLNEIKLKDKLVYNQEIIDAAIKAAEHCKQAKEKQIDKINKL